MSSKGKKRELGEGASLNWEVGGCRIFFVCEFLTPKEQKVRMVIGVNRKGKYKLFIASNKSKGLFIQVSQKNSPEELILYALKKTKKYTGTNHIFKMI